MSCQLLERILLGEGAAERLLAEDVTAGLQGRLHRREMKVGGHGNVHQVDLLAPLFELMQHREPVGEMQTIELLAE